jgi:hypothetical protein
LLQELAVAFLQLLTIFLYIIFFHIWLLETSQQVYILLGWLAGWMFGGFQGAETGMWGGCRYLSS